MRSSRAVSKSQQYFHRGKFLHHDHGMELDLTEIIGGMRILA
jgi:hypothetical protein